ncbi:MULTISPECIES: helix-turn-helix domain-containing protein [Streptomyces]|uniref:helix-turn-helix domain-containing protein n=1 Tax=Streptomyces TaxID=1883 RepID=UPI00345B95CE
MEGGKHYDADQRRRIGAELRALYEDGASIRELTRSTGRSYGFVHRILLEAGATLRGRGGPRFHQPGRPR